MGVNNSKESKEATIKTGSVNTEGQGLIKINLEEDIETKELNIRKIYDAKITNLAHPVEAHYGLSVFPDSYVRASQYKIERDVTFSVLMQESFLDLMNTVLGASKFGELAILAHKYTLYCINAKQKLSERISFSYPTYFIPKLNKYGRSVGCNRIADLYRICLYYRVGILDLIKKTC